MQYNTDERCNKSDVKPFFFAKSKGTNCVYPSGWQKIVKKKVQDFATFLM